MRHVFSREQLYELVWSEPTQKLAKSLGISDVGLAKACRKSAIPLPGRGYWAKLEAGKRVERPALPQRAFGSSGNVEIGLSEQKTPWPPEERIPDIPVEPSFAEPMEDVRERARRMVGSVSSPKSLTHPHAAIKKLLERDERRREKQAASPYPSFWDAPIFDSPAERRRLRILNAIFLALERCGGVAWTRSFEALEFGVLIGDIQVSFKLDRIEKHRTSSSKRATEGNHNPQERLRLTLEQWWSSMPALPSWEDGEAIQIESMLTEICVEMLVSAELILRHATQERYREQLAQRQRMLEQARMRAEQEEQTRLARIEEEKRQRRDQLLDEARRWRQASDLRAYIRAVMEFKAPPSGQLPGEIQAWVEWASREADQLDPLLRADKSLQDS